MKYIVSIALVALSGFANADLGSVSGGLSGVGAAGSSLPKHTDYEGTGKIKLREGFGIVAVRNPILVCVLDSKGRCYNQQGSDLKPLQFAHKMGYSKVHSKFIFHCDDGFGNVCMLLEVSK